ncbi:hypothetical protein CBR_g40560 [Chara braunii]|uniref:Integrase catalytic domain-containing protein n=1 Tax=Chara braunii TaxID=69332 RepID=A0A388K229_CHABU|nr:hypothetical protein CBR_g40560 [Chara braunii]|eukprot:GBG64112.1 hypothetical protein CBR_g40560 [Chara braunii]
MLALITEARKRADEVAAAEKKKAEDTEKARLLAIEQQSQQDEAAAKAANEERSQRREKIFNGERALLTMAADWRAEAENGKMEESESKIALLLSHFTVSSQRALHSRRTSTASTMRFRCTTRRLIKSTPASSSWSNVPSPSPVPAPPTPLIAATPCQRGRASPVLVLPVQGRAKHGLDDLLSKYGVVAADLYTKISWDDLKAAWHKRFQAEPPEIKAMGKLLTFEQGMLPSVDWIAEYQRLASVPDIQMGFKAVKHYFITRSCPALGNALTHDSARKFNIEVLDPLTSEDFAWLPLPTTGRLPGPQCAALCAYLHTYLSFYAPPTSPTDEAAVGDILAYVTKVVCEFRKQRYDDNNAPLFYVHIEVGQASCSALLDSGATHNSMSHAFMQRAGLGTQVRRKANPTAMKLADGRTQQLIDRYIEAVPMYFTPHACEPVTFDTLDTNFDIILGMPWLASADHTVNFHRQTFTVRNALGVEVPCTIPLPHPSIRCQVVTAKSFRATCAYEQPDEIGLCFLRTVAVADSSPTDLPSNPCVVQLLDEFIDIFESPTGVVLNSPISHEIILEAGVVPPRSCIYRMSDHAKAPELVEVPYAGWIRTKGYPKEIVCDCDTRFMSDFWLALIKRWGSSLKPSSARHPQTDGQTERAHQTTQVLLRTLIRPNQKNWVERLSDVELAYNSSIHPAIRMSPFEFEHGSPVTSPLDNIIPRAAESDDHLLFLRRMQELLVKAHDQIAKTQQRMSQQANRQRLPCPSRAGRPRLGFRREV